VLIAAGCLLALKLAGLMLDGGYTLGGLMPANLGAPSAPGLTNSSIQMASPSVELATGAVQRKPSWAQEMFGYPDVTGSVGASKPAEAKPAAADTAAPAAAAKEKPAEPARVPDGTVIPVDGNRPASPSERALLERLHERRQELDARARELDIRENLLKAAEKRVEGRVGELKDMEARLSSGSQKKDEAETERFKSLVTMYENMKAKDAARIFDRLDLKILVDVATQINPRRMSDILAQMSPEAAEKLTVELAGRASTARAPSTLDLPKIDGRPNGT
jgi:flagellar motility protein MotE (MotC chaperone)